MPPGNKGLAFQGAGSGRSKFSSMQVSGADNQRKGGGQKGKGYKKKKLLNKNYINNGGSGAQGGVGGVDVAANVQREKEQDDLDRVCGFHLFNEGPEKLGWLINFNTCSMEDKETGQLCSAVACYFICQSGEMFKCKLQYSPYFYLQVKDDRELEVEAYLRRKYEGLIKSVSIVYREDLDLKNHLAGHQRKLMKIAFDNTQALMEVRIELMPSIARNRANAKRSDAYSVLTSLSSSSGPAASAADALAAVEDMREYDVPFHIRYAIDAGIRVGHWYTMSALEGTVTCTARPELIFRGEPRVCAFDIETTKLPLHFPNAEHDQVFMISYMLDKQGYLIVNREVVGADIAPFEYSPKPEFPGPFQIFNEVDEKATLQRWFTHMSEVQPSIYVTYNGDNFDWPFIEARASHHGLCMHAATGFRVQKSGECLSKSAVHMDCFCWVNRDSYLPQGSRGLKAVTKSKLGYDPVEVDPEEMVPLAQTKPQAMASYSVSDAVATYYLYMTYIHPFIFSLATIIPMPPDDVLRKGSGTLCEHLLMVEAYRSNVVCPNKHREGDERFYKGRLLESETYIGGKVEAIESGVFRSDIPMRFEVQADGYQYLIDRLDKDLKYGLEVECGADVADLHDYHDVKTSIQCMLESLRDAPARNEKPLIYHLDVAAMYPNIILTNRLQPSAIVTDAQCAACDYNRPGKPCLRPMEWVWRGETFMLKQSEYSLLRGQLEMEKFPAEEEGRPPILGRDLPAERKAILLTDRIKRYTQRVYKKVSAKPETSVKVAGICQRENSFYVDTVLAFRDRRYEYKGLVKKWKKSLSAADAKGDKAAILEAQDMIVLYDSLQLAHKCILNSFYGYVMRKGARWYSMEMAGVTTYTGAQIIKRACDLIYRIGRPLELDTDGIWCCLPGSFPEEFSFTSTTTGKPHKINYPGLILNVICAEHNTNHQYHTLAQQPDGGRVYEAMILPASKEEGKLIKKRYAVFNPDGTLAELKGFEIKRRGELKLIKVFQSEVFDHFLAGETLEQCYESVASVANRWLDLLDTRGLDLKDAELIEYLSESSVMSKTLEEYGARKSCAITTARRLAQFLGDDRLKDKGLVCKYITACKPRDAPTSERAIPVIIFSAAPAVARAFLRRWTGEAASGAMHEPVDVREYLDWDYYRERLSSTIQKIITIPAAYQKLENPVPRVAHPDWLHKRFAAAASSHKQRLISNMFANNPSKRPPAGEVEEVDMEDLPATTHSNAAARMHAKKHRVGTARVLDSDDDAAEADDAPDDAADPDALEDDVALEEEEDPDENVPSENIPEGGNRGAGVRQKQGTLGGMVARRPTGPSMKSDYRAWIKARKPVWRQHRMNLRAHRASGGAVGATDIGALGGLGGGLQKQVAAVMHATWHIIQVEPTGKPGVLDVWTLIDTSMHKMTLNVPRTMYVDVTAGSMHLLESNARFAGAVRKVDRTLPDGSTPEALLELELPEEDFVQDHNSIARMLGAPHIRGCYESRTPACLSALAHLSCTARVADRSLAAPPRAWTLHHLFRHPSHAPSYLSGDTSASAATPVTTAPRGERAARASLGKRASAASRTETEGALGLLRYVIVVVLEGERGGSGRAAGRGVWAVVLPQAKKVVIVVLQKDSSAARELVSVTAQEIWEEVFAEAAQVATGPTLKDASDYAVEVAYVRDAASARTHLASDLAVFRASHRGPMLALLVTPTAAATAALRRAAPALRAMPCCAAPPPAAADIAAAFSESDGVPWQESAPRAALVVAAEAPAWLQERADLARYAGVPLCNLAGDAEAAHHAAMDAAFARSLRSANHLLWAEDRSLPDVVPAHQRVDEAGVPGPDPVTIDNPGAYRCFCVELQPQFLLLDAVLQADDLAEAEGSLAIHTHGGRSLSALRSLLLSWATDASSRSNKVADDLIRRVHAWLLSPTSPLYSPQLLAIVHTSLTKVFLQLLAELRSLDASIVSASPSSIVISTRKHNAAAARAYVLFLVDTVAQRSLFQWVSLRPSRAWAALLWRDAFNFSGVQVPIKNFAEPTNAAPDPAWIVGGNNNNKAAELAAGGKEGLDGVGVGEGGSQGGGVEGEGGLEDDEEEGGEGGVVYVSEWNIREFLPAAVRQYFDDIVERFVTKPYGFVQDEEGGAQGGTQGMVRTSTIEARTREFLHKWLPLRLLERLFEMVKTIHHRVLPGSENPAFQFPRPPGSHLPEDSLGTAALAFVRTICHVLGLDNTCQDEVAAIRRQLLTMLHVREFADEAEWVDPCCPLVLPAVACSECFAVSALDVTRTATQPGAWCCGACAHPYATPVLEAALMQRLQVATAAAVVCDLQCARCKAMSRGGAQSVCGECGASLVFARDGGKLQLEARVVESVAEFHGLELLNESASWIVNG